MPKVMFQESTSTSANGFSDKEQRIYDFLSANPIAVLSSVTPDGNPHGVVLYFSVDKKFVASILTKIDTRKYDNLTHNDHAMLTVFEPRTQTTVQLTGKAKEITDRYEINVVAETNMQASIKTSTAGMPPILKLKAGQYVAFRIYPEQINMAVYAHADSGDYSQLFETLENFETSI
jgi:general stress protein 26